MSIVTTAVDRLATRILRPAARRVRRRYRAMAGSRAPIRVGRYMPPRPSAPLPAGEAATVDAFHDLYYEAWREDRGTIDLAWFGYRTLKCPFDLWTYQEILVETRPQLIVETGTAFGGSALFLASMFDLLGDGRIITIDVKPRPNRPQHPRITYVEGSSVDPDILELVRIGARDRRVMVILDSDHSRTHVEAELRAYRDIVTPGCYLVVEDSNVNGHPVWPDFGPGPMEAIDAFLSEARDYEIDLGRQRFLVTLNPRGFLRRIG